MKKVWIALILLFCATVAYLAPKTATRMEAKLGIKKLDNHMLLAGNNGDWSPK